MSYINNVHILVYVAFGLVGIIVGKVFAWVNVRLCEEKRIISKDFFYAYKDGIKHSYINMIIVAILYVALLAKFGLGDKFIKNLDLIKFLILIPMLVSTFLIDLEHRIIPNRINLTIFEIGLVLTFIYGINNINLATDMLLGMIIGGGIFLIITLIGGLVAGKEAMGFGDVKFMGAIGLFFGSGKIAEISLLAFFIGAITSIIILFIRIVILKNKDEYIPFGPFLVVSSIACIFLPANTVFILYMSICGAISQKILSII